MNLETHLKNNGFLVTRLSHALRINGVVDIWHNGKTVFDNIKKEYVNYENPDTQIKEAMNLAKTYPKKEPFKKLSTGRMSYQEFKNKKTF